MKILQLRYCHFSVLLRRPFFCSHFLQLFSIQVSGRSCRICSWLQIKRLPRMVLDLLDPLDLLDLLDLL